MFKSDSSICILDHDLDYHDPPRHKSGGIASRGGAANSGSLTFHRSEREDRYKFAFIRLTITGPSFYMGAVSEGAASFGKDLPLQEARLL